MWIARLVYCTLFLDGLFECLHGRQFNIVLSKFFLKENFNQNIYTAELTVTDDQSS